MLAAALRWYIRDGALHELEQRLLHALATASDAVAIDIEGESHDGEARLFESRTPLAGKRKVGERTTQKH